VYFLWFGMLHRQPIYLSIVSRRVCGLVLEAQHRQLKLGRLKFGNVPHVDGIDVHLSAAAVMGPPGLSFLPADSLLLQRLVVDRHVVDNFVAVVM
jgi:hypothetical protein